MVHRIKSLTYKKNDMPLEKLIVEMLSKEENKNEYHTIFEIINEKSIPEHLEVDFADLTNEMMRENKEMEAIALSLIHI